MLTKMNHFVFFVTFVVIKFFMLAGMKKQLKVK